MCIRSWVIAQRESKKKEKIVFFEKKKNALKGAFVFMK